MNDEGEPGLPRFSVPEPQVVLGPGVLTEHWQSGDPLPTIEGLERLWYQVQRGTHAVLALPTSAAITVATVAISLFLFGGFLLILQNVGKVLTEAGSPLHLTAYIKEGSDEGAVSAFVRDLEANTKVRQAEVVSKPQALESFRRDLGEKSTLLAGLDEKNNPLPASVEIILRPSVSQDAVDKIVEALQQHALIQEVAYGGEWVERMQGIVQVFRLFGTVGLGVVLIIIIFLIANTIRLVIFSRREEIGIMQLVGASDSFIKVPFITGGIIQGFVGAVAGLALLKIGFSLINMHLKNSVIFGVALPEIAFLSIWTTFGIALLGIVVGAAGSFFALRKLLNV